MRRIVRWLSIVVIAALGWGAITASAQDTVFRDDSMYPTPTESQDAASTDTSTHPIIGTWIVDTVNATDTDSPEVGIFLPGGSMVGQGANRVAGGSWEVIDDRTVMMTLVTVSDTNGAGSYVVVRGPHQLDESGDSWTCACTFTVVGADGTVLDSGDAPASATRLHVQGPEAVGTSLDEVPTWTPATPTGLQEFSPASRRQAF